MRKKYISLNALLFLIPVYSFACTEITHDFGNGQFFSARTFDFCQNVPTSIVIYPRNMHESGGVAFGKPIHWTSKYASAAVALQLGTSIGIPDGLNEKGLGVHILYLGSGKYAKTQPDKVSIDLFIWAKYILDNFASVDQVLADFNNYQIVNTPVMINGVKVNFPAHFAIEDRTGKSAIIELTAKGTKIYQSKGDYVMANEPPYDQQQRILSKYKQGTQYNLKSLPGGALSSHRFIRASFYNENLPHNVESSQILSYMFSAISGAYTPYFIDYPKHCGFVDGTAAEDVWPTQWVTVLDHKDSILYFQNIPTNSTFKVELNKYNLSAEKPIVVNVAQVNGITNLATPAN